MSRVDVAYIISGRLKISSRPTLQAEMGHLEEQGYHACIANYHANHITQNGGYQNPTLSQREVMPLLYAQNAILIPIKDMCNIQNEVI